MLEKLKSSVLKANLELNEKGLVIYTWGNVSGIDRTLGIMAIKPSGVSYEKMKAEDIVLVDMKGNIVEGTLNPSSDTDTHLELYRQFPRIGGICHTHSPWATIYAQGGMELPPYGTTHADYFHGAIPCTGNLTQKEIDSQYELNTGRIIVETFKDKDYMSIPAVFVRNHAPFTWGTSAENSVYHAVVLEEIARMGWMLQTGFPGTRAMPEALLNKHFLRKNGNDAYYGQKK